MSELANALFHARSHGGLINREDYSLPNGLDAAYQEQTAITSLFQSETIGWKLGATNNDTLKLLGFEEPFIGPLLSTHWYSNGSEVPVYPEHSPALETEFLVRLGADLPPRQESYSIAEVTAAIGYVCPAFEIVGCRMQGGLGEAGLMLIPDGAANVAIVQGEASDNWRQADFSNHALQVQVNGKQVATGSSSILLWGNPLGAVVWLAGNKYLGTRGLRRGDYIMTGTCGGLIPLQTGDYAEADFGILGSVSLTVGNA